jgi:hypothetical protein
MSEQFDDYKWEERSQSVAYLVPHGVDVLNLGGGEGRIRKYLQVNSYTCLDLYEHDGDTIKTDLNGELPELQNKYFMTATGVLEYLKDVPKFLKDIQKYGNNIVFTYYQLHRKIEVWSNNYTYVEIMDILKKVGWKLQHIKPIFPTGEMIFVCKL